ncbi:MAG: hypothetical protein OQL28_13005 [Sedimenticola sp.]|nr:hypothetical protein [Sedimenticola sp.]
MRYRLAALICKSCLALLAGFPVYGQAAESSPIASGGAACVIAKKLGDSLDIAWATGAGSVSDAISQAKQELRKRGYPDLFPQANSDQPHGWMVIVKTGYRNARGRPRTSYGCGFNTRSATAAEQDAVDNLRSYSWGWRPDFGYQVIEKTSY